MNEYVTEPHGKVQELTNLPPFLLTLFFITLVCHYDNGWLIRSLTGQRGKSMI